MEVCRRQIGCTWQKKLTLSSVTFFREFCTLRVGTECALQSQKSSVLRSNPLSNDIFYFLLRLVVGMPDGMIISAPTLEIGMDGIYIHPCQCGQNQSGSVISYFSLMASLQKCHL